MIPTPPELLVVMPVYNEVAALAGVLDEWTPVLDAAVGNYRWWVIEDASTDATPSILAARPERTAGKMDIHTHPENRGHGQSCLEGYRAACAQGIPWVFQIDSDGQCDPAFFSELWQGREQADVHYGCRIHREDGWRRVLAGRLLRLLLRLSAGVDCPDANVPYRLLRTRALPPLLERIPADFDLANIALAVLLRRDPSTRQRVIPITFCARRGGEPTVPLRRFGRKALELHRDLRRLR